MRELGIDESTVTLKGGEASQGHPIGAGGAVRLITLLYAMKNEDIKRGMASLCLEGGKAVKYAIGKGLMATGKKERSG